MLNKKLLIVGLYLLAAPSAAFAYLDPGSGSMLLYFIMGIFASLIYYFKGLAYKIRAFFTGSKIDKDLSNLAGIDILFHSEGGQYWNVFLPIIEELERQGVKSAYYTQKQDDPGLVTDFKHLKSAYIGNDLSSYALLNNIKVKLFVSTTPQLDVMQWRKSKNVENYIHIIHAPTGVLMYKYYSFDFFDTIMCSGQHQIDSLRALEEARKLPAKELLETGLTYYDVMAQAVETKSPAQQAAQKTLLIAPTWKADNLLEKHGSKPLIQLAELGYKVIVRPHPQAFISTPDVMEQIQQDIKNYPAISFDTKPTGIDSMAQADLLISDLSGILFDFLFVFNKPVIAIKGNIEKDGKEVKSVTKEAWELENLEQLATLIEIHDIQNIEQYIQSSLAKMNQQKIQELRDKSLFNYGKAGLVAAEQLLEKVRN